MIEIKEPTFSSLEVWRNLHAIYCDDCPHTYCGEKCKAEKCYSFVRSIDYYIHKSHESMAIDGRCQNCGGTVGRSGDYCKWCGQKIKKINL